jgi:hypothetical protein
MNDVSSMRSRWEAGCLPAFVAGWLLWAALKSIDVAIDWLVGMGAGPGKPQGTLTIFKVAAFVILGPVLAMALAQLRTHGVAWSLVRFFSFWLQGVKVILFCFLVFFPYLILWTLLKHVKDLGIEPGSTGAWLFLLLLGIAFLAVPFWTLPQVRRLSRTVLGRNALSEAWSQQVGPRNEL